MSASRFFPATSLCLLLLVTGLLTASVAQGQVVTAGPDSARNERLLGRKVTRVRKAALLALALPGAGQVYNHKYWKLPLAYGALGGVGYGLYTCQTRYREYAKGKQDLIEGRKIGELEGKLVSQELSEAGVTTGLNIYRSRRDTFVGYSVLVYAITVLDAVVDAHLRDFDISNDLSVRLQPTLLPVANQFFAPGLQANFRLKGTTALKTNL